MIKKIVSTSVVIGTMFMVIGCGGGSSSSDTSSLVTGQFVDTHVSGLNYACSSGTTGITNSDGEYTCNTGDIVEFSLGDYVVGSATASSGIVTPMTLYPDNAEAALNVAQLLQTLDTDPTDDIITIAENFTELDDMATTPEDVNFDDLIETELGITLVSGGDAQDHLDETILMLLLADGIVDEPVTIYSDDGTWFKSTELYDENDIMVALIWEKSDGTYGDCHYTRYDDEEIRTSRCTTYYANGTVADTMDNTFDENGINLTRDHKMIELDGSWYHTIVIYDGTSSTNIIKETWERSDGAYANLNFTYHSNGVLERREETRHNSTVPTDEYFLTIYDENGLAVTGEYKATDADGIWGHSIYTYDENGKLIHTTYTQSDGLVYGTIDYIYHSNGELSNEHNERHYKNPEAPWAVIYLVTIYDTNGDFISYDQYFEQPW